MKGEYHLFEGRCMFVSQQVVDQTGVLTDSFGPFALRNSGSLNDTLIASHVVHKSDKTLVQYREFLVQYFFSFWYYTSPHIVLLIFISC